MRFSKILVCCLIGIIILSLLACCTQGGASSFKQGKEMHTTSYSFPELADSLRLWGGRTNIVPEGLIAEWSCSGFEICFETAGTNFDVTYKASYESYWRVYVDGKALPERIYCPENEGETSVIFVENMTAGTHTVKIIKDSQIDKTKNAYCTLTGVSFDGTLLTADRTERALYLEFVGDSLSSGSGALGNAGSSPTYSSEISGTSAYPYLIADALDADYSIVSRGGIGVTTKAGDYTMPELYPYLNGYRDKTPYEPTRAPDLVIINLGTNDTEDLSDYFITDGQELIQTIRSIYGQDVKIVWVYGMFFEDHLVDEIRQMADDAGGEENEVYTFQMIYGRNGSGSKDDNRHPSAADQQKNAEHLLLYLKQLMQE